MCSLINFLASQHARLDFSHRPSLHRLFFLLFCFMIGHIVQRMTLIHIAISAAGFFTKLLIFHSLSRSSIPLDVL